METVKLADVLFHDKEMNANKRAVSSIAGKRLGDVSIPELMGLIQKQASVPASPGYGGAVATPTVPMLELPMLDDEEE